MTERTQEEKDAALAEASERYEVSRDAQRLALVADVLAWTLGYECTDDDSLSAAQYDGCYEWASWALADIDKARADG